jgi:hypothetical protein
MGMQVNEHMKVERQIILNPKLAVLVSEDPPDGYCKGYMYYVEKNKLAEKTIWRRRSEAEWKAKWEEEWKAEREEFDPFLEILILSGLSGSDEPDRQPDFSFMVSFVSSDELDPKQWREVRDIVQKHLREFEREKFNTKGKLFFQTVKDSPVSERKTDMEILILSDRPALDEPDPLLGFSFDEPDPLLDISSDKPGLPLNLSFMVSFVSSFELDIKQWREIRNVVQKYLRDFEQEQSDTYFKGLDPTTRDSEERYFQVYVKLFYPTNKDLCDPGMKSYEIEARLKAALELKQLYEHLRDEIRENHKKAGYLEELATRFGMSINEVNSILYPHSHSKRSRPAELAKELLLKLRLTSTNFIRKVNMLEYEILHRDPRKFFDGYKKGTKLKRPLVYLAKSDPIQPDIAAKNYNTQGLRLKKLTVEKVWQGHV